MRQTYEIEWDGPKIQKACKALHEKMEKFRKAVEAFRNEMTACLRDSGRKKKEEDVYIASRELSQVLAALKELPIERLNTETLHDILAVTQPFFELIPATFANPEASFCQGMMQDMEELKRRTMVQIEHRR